MLALGWVARGRVETTEDYVVAGRRLGLGLAAPTLLATWFGAGTLLVAADEVAAEGLAAAALDPVGAGLCLLLAGALIARPLWRMRLVTLSDFYGRVFGPRAERWSAALMVPGYIGWIAAQYAALAAVVAAATGLSAAAALALTAAVGIGYTLLGGMWAVTITDAAQLAIAIGSLAVVAVAVALHLGDGALGVGLSAWGAALRPTGPLIPAAAALPALTALAAGALGNLPGQDLAQRLFAARSAGVAQAACWVAGGAYLALGAVPVALALAAPAILGEVPDGGVLQAIAAAVAHPAVQISFALGVAACVLSTIDSAILAPATVIARNLVGPWRGESLVGHRVAVLLVGLAALGLAAIGEDAYALLEASYEVSMVSLLVPLLFGLWWPRGQVAALAAMAVGTGSWAAHLALGAEGLLGGPVPMGLGSTALAAAAYALAPAGIARPPRAALTAPERLSAG